MELTQLYLFLFLIQKYCTRQYWTDIPLTFNLLEKKDQKKEKEEEGRKEEEQGRTKKKKERGK